MQQFRVYSSRFGSLGQGASANVRGLPAWGRLLVMVAAVPGIVALIAAVLGLVLAFGVLLILTVPVYAVCQKVNNLFAPAAPTPTAARTSSKRIESTVVDG